MNTTKNINIKDLTKSPRIQTVVDLMQSVSEEIEAIKDGRLDGKTGSLVLRGRAIMLRGVELTLQAARLDHGMRKDLSKRIGPFPEISGEEVKSVAPLKIK
jgi:hypothetical protein